MSYSLIIIGAGLSGIAAGIRCARFGHKVLILEKHAIAGGLNSYYYRKGRLLETGLHAMTNFADPADKHAPLNILFRQLKLSRKKFSTHEQLSSLIYFPEGRTLKFSNHLGDLREEVARLFPESSESFQELVRIVEAYDPFVNAPYISTRQRLKEILGNEILADMILWPIMMYGSCRENDIDFSQFVIMFRAIYEEGFFRPEGTVKDFLDMLLAHYEHVGGEIRFKSGVRSIRKQNGRVNGVRLESGEEIDCDYVISTAGYPATLDFLGRNEPEKRLPYEGRMSFFEDINIVPIAIRKDLLAEHTIIFYHLDETLNYCRPSEDINPNCGVICFSDNFQGIGLEDTMQIRVTHPANYEIWKNAGKERYEAMKAEASRRSREIVAKIIGNYHEKIVYHDSFTPVTVEKFTAKAQGAVYGSPIKLKDGRTDFENLFVAGTDQGFLGIVGSMLSGVTIVNEHILAKL